MLLPPSFSNPALRTAGSVESRTIGKVELVAKREHHRESDHVLFQHMSANLLQVAHL